jgi:FkbM family methyltransferase
MSVQTRLAGLRQVLFFDNWPMLILQRLFDRKTGLVVYRKNGTEFIVDHRGGDENGTRSCVCTDMYRRYLRRCKLPKRIALLDLGANGGGFPLMLQTQGIEIARAVCVEMNPPTAQRLIVNMTTNFGHAVVALNATVCGMHGSKIRLKLTRGGTSISMANDQVEGSAPSYSVPTTTLSDLCEMYFGNNRIDVCKIDIEGAEYEVFDSSPDEMLRRIGYLFIEFHEASKTPVILERLLALGFADITDVPEPRTSLKTEVRVFRGPEGSADTCSAGCNN